MASAVRSSDSLCSSRTMVESFAEGSSSSSSSSNPYANSPGYSLSSSSSSAPSMLAETAIRRQIKADVLAVQHQIEKSQLNDETSLLLKNWGERFLEVARTHPDIQVVKEQFILLLMDILVDPFGVPLTEDALAGSDGKTYGTKSLSVYLHRAPEPYRYRPPLSNPNEAPKPFTTTAHPIVPTMVRWLESEKANLHSEEIQAAEQELSRRSKHIEGIYQELSDRRDLPTIPTVKSERLRLIREKKAQREHAGLAQGALLDRHLSVIQTELQQRVEAGFAPVHQRAEAVAQRQIQELGAVGQRDQERLQLAEQRVQLLETDTQRLQRENEQLRVQTRQLEQVIDKVKQEDTKLALAINETRIEIRKRQERESKSWVTCLVIVGFCIVAACLLPPMAGAAGGAAGGGAAGGAAAGGAGAATGGFSISSVPGGLKAGFSVVW